MSNQGPGSWKTSRNQIQRVEASDISRLNSPKNFSWNSIRHTHIDKKKRVKTKQGERQKKCPARYQQYKRGILDEIINFHNQVQLSSCLRQWHNITYNSPLCLFMRQKKKTQTKSQQTNRSRKSPYCWIYLSVSSFAAILENQSAHAMSLRWKTILHKCLLLQRGNKHLCQI